MFTQNQDILSAEELPPIDEGGEGVVPGASDAGHQSQLKTQDSKEGGEAGSSAVRLMSESQTELGETKVEGEPGTEQAMGPIDKNSAEGGDDDIERA